MTSGIELCFVRGHSVFILFIRGLEMAHTLKVKRQIEETLIKRGVLYCMPATYGLGCLGVSDFIACHRGVFIGLMANVGKGTITTLQDGWLDQVIASGGRVLVLKEGEMEQLEGALNLIEVEYTYSMQFILN